MEQKSTGQNAQEMGLWLCFSVDSLGLSQEIVQTFGGLFLATLKWYEAEEVARDKSNESIITDRKYSLLVELRSAIQQETEVPSGPMISLLQRAMNEYRVHLLSLKEKPWVRQESITDELNQMKDFIVRVNSSSPK